MDASVELVKQLIPSVVNVYAEVPAGHPSAKILGTERMGSGTVVDATGLVLTVNYVVMGGGNVQVSFLRGRSARAEIAAQDFEVGLALVKVKRKDLQAAVLGSSESVEPGAPVFSLASTGPRERRVAGGTVTYLGEFDAHWEYLLDRAIVTSVPNPGFGGGPLFTMSGQMIGVVSLNLNEIARMSLAIPIEYYRDYREELLRFGRVRSRPKRAWLGLFVHPLEEGVVVSGLVPGGPADRSGFREGDMIVSLGSEETPTRKDFYRRLWRHGPGERVSFEVMRENELKRLEITGGDRAEFYK